MKWFTRLSAGFSKKLDNLAAAVSLFMAYYCWRPRHTHDSGQSGRRRVTPAMAAGVVNELWTLETLYDRAMG